MRVISPLLKRIVYPGLSMTGYLRRRWSEGVAVLTYHGVLPRGYKIIDSALDGSLVTAQALSEQLQFLKKHYEVISPGQFLRSLEGTETLRARSVLLTCDDGLRNTVTEMLPLLAELDLQCLFFVTGASLDPSPSMLWHEELYLMLLRASTAGLRALSNQENLTNVTTGKRSLWSILVQELSKIDAGTRRVRIGRLRTQLGLADDWASPFTSDESLFNRFYVLDGGGLQQLQNAGMSIGGHTASHPMLSQLPDPIALQEISDCRSGLQRVLERPVWALAYPFGDPESLGAREIQIAKNVGYTCGFVSVGGGFGARRPRFAIPRVHVGQNMRLAEFEAHLSGFYRSMRHRLLQEQAEFGPSCEATA